MLVESRVHFLVGQGQVRLDIVRKFDNLQIYAFFGQERFNFIEYFAVRDRRCRYGDDRIFVASVPPAGVDVPQPASSAVTEISAAPASKVSFLNECMSKSSFAK